MSPDVERQLREGDVPFADLAEVDRRRPHRAFLTFHSFEVGIAVAAVLSALQFILDPAARELAAVDTLGTAFSWIWTVFYLMGGFGIIWGMFKVDDRVELAGLSCFSAAAIVNAAALVQVRGAGGVYVALSFLAFVGGAAGRIWILLALRRLTRGARAQRREE